MGFGLRRVAGAARGACYDARTRRLYLCVTWAYPNGRESYPAIHTYCVR